ncbi:hypothetical protein [Nostoc sp. MG11]|uniref:hypothetical protein n=1 Tax=Nostoc sp. MG11 TaxID=2721166 RepID=UPI001866C7E8|nr:hypothetical protein [Nostoc sp. MG11]
MDSSLKRNIAFAFIGALFSFILTLSSTASIAPTEQLHKIILPAIISIPPGLIAGLLFAFIQTYQETLIEYKQEVRELTKILDKNEKHLEQIYDFVDAAKSSLNHYATVRGLLIASKTHRYLVESFIEKAVGHPCYIPRASEDDFYEILTLGIRASSKSWCAIHQGQISKLGFNPIDNEGEFYFSSLRNSDSHIEKKRIIILNKDEQQELTNPNIMKAFWDKTGRDIPSYWISDDYFYNLTRLSRDIRVDDCALHDDEVLLHYHRENKLIMLAFEDSRDPIWSAVKKLFQRLDTLGNRKSSEFNSITQQEIDNLINQQNFP